MLQAQQPTTPPNTEQSKAAKGTDPALLNWESKNKYFLIVAASKTAGQNSHLPYAEVDGRKVDAVFSKRGYKKIDTLVGPNSTREAFVEKLKQVRTLGDDSLAVVYYSGHAAPDPQGADLWLQLYGQSYFGESQGLAVSQLVKTARAGQYKGELVIIIDACYGGAGAWTNSLNVSELENTVIFTSSSRTQESFAVDISPTETMSAFTYYLLEGLTADWDTVDEDKDGIIRYTDLQTYIDAQLRALTIKDHQPDRDMTPALSGQQTMIWAAFDPQKALNLTSLLRRALRPRVGLLERQLPRILQSGVAPAPEVPVVPEAAAELSKRVPENADPYTLALKAIAQNRNVEALRLLDQAEKSQALELTDIYQARGSSKLYEGRFIEAKEWFEKALAINQKENPELLEDAALVHLATLDLSRSEQLLSQAIAIRRRGDNSGSQLREDLVAISMIFLLQGRTSAARSSLIEANANKPAVSSDEDLGSLAETMLVIVTSANGDVAEAEKLAEEISASSNDSQSSQLSLGVAFLALSGMYDKRGQNSKRDEYLDKAFSTWEQAVTLRNSMAVEFLTEFAVGYQAGSKRLLGSPTAARSRFFDIAQKSLDLIKTEFGLKSREVSVALLNLGLAYIAQNKYVKGERILKESAELADKSFGDTTLFSLYVAFSLGGIYDKLGRYTNAESALKNSIEISERITGQNLFLGESLERLASLYKAHGRYSEAAPYYERAVEVNRQAGVTGPCTCLTDLAGIYHKLNRYTDAESILKNLLKLTRETEGNIGLTETEALIYLGTHYYLRNDLKKARSTFEDVIRNAKEDSSVSQSENSIISRVWLSEISRSEQRFAEAKSSLEAVLSLVQKLPGEKQDAIISALVSIAYEYVSLERVQDAERILQTVQYLYTRPENTNRVSAANNLYAIGGLLINIGNYGNAAQLYGRATSIVTKLQGPDDPQLVTYLFALATALKENSQYPEAINSYKEALRIAELSEDQISQVGIAFGIGVTYLWSNKYSEAELWLSRAKNDSERLGLSHSVQYSDSLVSLASAVIVLRSAYDEAEKLAQGAVSVDEQLGQFAGTNLTDDLRILADVYRFQRKFKEAEKALQRAQQALQYAHAYRLFTEAKLLIGFALLYQAEGKDSKAQETVTNAINLITRTSVKDRGEFVSWLKFHETSLNVMTRPKEATLLAATIQRLQALPSR